MDALWAPIVPFVTEGQILYLDRLPVGRKGTLFFRAMSFGIGLHDLSGCLYIGVMPDDFRVLPGNIVKHTGEALHIADEGDQAPYEKELSWFPVFIDVPDDNHRIDQFDNHIHGKPFPLIDQGLFAEGREYVHQLLQQSALHAFFQAQGDDGEDIGEAVEQGGRNDMFLLIGLIECPEERFVEPKDSHNGQYAQDNSYEPKSRGEIEHGDKGKRKFSEGVDIDKAIFKKLFQPFVGFAHAVDGGTAVVVLMPFNG